MVIAVAHLLITKCSQDIYVAACSAKMYKGTNLQPLQRSSQIEIFLPTNHLILAQSLRVNATWKHVIIWADSLQLIAERM